jgi:hypothetical protein
VQGETLTAGMNTFSQACVEYSDDARVFHLKNFIRPLVRRASARTALSASTRATIQAAE